MILNFIIDSDLERFYPDLESYRAGAQVDFSEQIDLAFEILLNDFQARGKSPRLLGVPLDLNRNDTSTHLQQLASTTISATTNAYAWEGGNERRFHVNLTSKTELGDDWDFILQGSNKNERPTDADSTWETVATLDWPAAAAASEDSVVFRTAYRWYRVRAVKNSGTGSVTYTACIHDTIFDNLITWKAIELIAMSWDTGLSTLWQTRVEEAKASYTSAIERIITTYDSDEDGIPEFPEERITTSVRFSR
jgi:hypothetical protein